MSSLAFTKHTARTCYLDWSRVSAFVQVFCHVSRLLPRHVQKQAPLMRFPVSVPLARNDCIQCGLKNAILRADKLSNGKCFYIAVASSAN
jgi:hypothetical protein